jgi:hypothetical protein
VISLDFIESLLIPLNTGADELFNSFDITHPKCEEEEEEDIAETYYYISDYFSRSTSFYSDLKLSKTKHAIEIL